MLLAKPWRIRERAHEKSFIDPGLGRRHLACRVRSEDLASPPAGRAAAAVAPPAVVRDWSDIPLSPGEWSYLESANAEARFEGGQGVFILHCDRSTRRLTLSRQLAGAGPMTIRTSAGLKTFASADVETPASDSFLDAMVFSRGRITVEAAGAPMLVIPTWPEPARVVEECRG
jgi:hypothetical protein